MSTTQQPEALDLANWLDAVGNGGISSTAAAAELRRQHARIAELEAQLEAIGAGGVQALSAAPARLLDAARMAVDALDWLPTSDQTNALWQRQQPALEALRNALAASPTPPAEQQRRPQPWGSDGLMAVSAFRYCLGRMTYIVGDCERWLFANWQDFPENVRKLIQREVEEEFRRDDEARARGAAHKPLGHDCDRAAWERVRGLWRAAEPTPDGRSASWSYARAIEAAHGIGIKGGQHGINT